MIQCDTLVIGSCRSLKVKDNGMNTIAPRHGTLSHMGVTRVGPVGPQSENLKSLSKHEIRQWKYNTQMVLT